MEGGGEGVRERWGDWGRGGGLMRRVGRLSGGGGRGKEEREGISRGYVACWSARVCVIRHPATGALFTYNCSNRKISSLTIITMDIVRPARKKQLPSSLP